MSSRRGRSLFLVFGLVVVLAGCSDSGGTGGKLVAVKGKVMLGDEPLTRGSVSFRLQDAKPGGSSPEPYGSIGSDGSYTLFTNQKEGAPIGKYFVIVESTEAPTEGATVTPKSLIPKRYSDIELKLLPIEIVEKPSPGQYDLKLTK